MTFRLPLASLLATAALAPMAAHAAQAAGSDASSTSAAQAASKAPVLQEVVVTAQKRSDSSQKTPIALDVVSGDSIREQNINDVQGLTRLAPDLGFTVNTQDSQLSLRGISAQSVAEGVDAALTVNVDGEYINRPTSLNASFFDLDRIEVLKGPQGTLYGRNATAGAINIITAKPSGTFGGYLTAGVGNYDAYNVEGAINIPITDGLAVRLSGFHNEHEGYTDNSPSGRYNDMDMSGGRASIQYKKNGLTAWFSVEHIDVDERGTGQFGVPINAGSQGLVTISGKDAAGQTVTDQVPAGNLGVSFPKNAYRLSDNTGYYKNPQWSYRAKIDYDFGNGFDLAYVGGYYDQAASAQIPLTGTPNYIQYQAYNPKTDVTDLSNEVHLSYKNASGLFVQVGGFYFREVQNVDESTQIINPPFGPPGSPIAYANYFFRPNFTTDSYSFFGQADVPITSTLKLTAGVRYSDDKKSAIFYDSAFGFINPTFGLGAPTAQSITAAVGGIPTVCGTQKADGTGNSVIKQCYSKGETNWLVGAEWTPKPGHMIYGKVSTAYRSGGFDDLTDTKLNGVSVGNFQPEQILDYEIGSKNRFYHDRLELNVDAFYYDYTNLQVDSFLNTTIGHYTANAGKARNEGVEGELTWLATRADRLTFTADWLSAKYLQFNTVETGISSNAVPVSLAGNDEPQSPSWILTAGLQHKFDLGDAGQIVADAYTRYKTSYYLTSYNWASDKQPGFGQTDLSLTYLTANKKYSVEMYVHNLEGYRPVVYSGWTGGSNVNIYNFMFGDPRTFGLKATAKF